MTLSMIPDLPRERFAAFSEVVRTSTRRGRWLVLTHDNPDPDALASTAVLARLLRQVFKRPVTVAYGGIIGRAENREMVRCLGLSFSQLRYINWKNYQHFALVDTQPRTGNNQLPKEIVPDVVIDHHPMRKASRDARFVDIRRDYGATATILGEYLLASGQRPTKRHATALVYAIMAETQDFARESSGPDHAVHDLLLPRSDRRALARIQHARVPLSYFADLRRALDGMATVATLVVSHLGRVEQPDIVPEIADLLLRLDGKTWSLCTGLYADRIYLSLRTTNPRADAGNLMRRLLARRGKGGGHGMLAGGWVPAPKANGDAGALERELARDLARALGKNPDRLQPLALPRQAARPAAFETPPTPRPEAFARP